MDNNTIYALVWSIIGLIVIWTIYTIELHSTLNSHKRMYADACRDLAYRVDKNLRLIEENERLKRDISIIVRQVSERTTQNLDNDDIKRMLMLCHPDKHGGKQMAIDITQKLLKMRKE